MGLKRSSLLFASLTLGLSLGAVRTARAQVPFTGWELALSGSDVVHAGRGAPIRGSSLHVRGLATLVPESTALRARFASRTQEDSSAWTSFQSDNEGRFVFAVPIPDDAGGGEPRLEIEVGPDHQRFVVPVRVTPAERVTVRADRRLYEPGETVHVWGLVRDEATLAPLPDFEVEVELSGSSLPPTRHTLRTAESGALHLALPTTAQTPHGNMQVHVRHGDRQLARTEFAVGTRTYDRLLVNVDLGETAVAPGGRREALVTVQTPDGSPVAGAAVRATVAGTEAVPGTSGADGVARLSLRAPLFFGSRVGQVRVSFEVEHSGLGSITASALMRLAVPQSLQVELVPPHGGLLPEVDEVLYVRVHDGYDHPPAPGTRVTLQGAIFAGGEAVGQTDDAGLLEVPVSVPRGAATRTSSGHPTAPVHVQVDGPLQRRVRASVRVLEDSDVAPVLDRVVLSPGDALSVRVLRRPRFQGDIVVELLADGRPLMVRWLARPTGRAVTERVVFDVPPHLGLLQVRARPVHAGDTLEGTGAETALIVRPPSPDAPRLDPERTRLSVGETAHLRLHTTPGRPGYAAVSVRDLSAHGGEQPFEAHFLASSFEEALLRAGEPGGRLVRVALAAHDQVDPAAPEVSPRLDALGMREPSSSTRPPRDRHVLRDPYPLARALERRGINAPMYYAEQALTRALNNGTLENVVEGQGRQRTFREDLFGDRDETTLGGAPITPARITEAAPSFSFETVSRRVARRRLVGLILALARYLDPGDHASPAARMAARAPVERWVPHLAATLGPHALDDPWGGRFALRPTRSPRLVLSARAAELEWVSAGPDGRFGTADDLRDPFLRVIPRGTAYADASGEDALMRTLAVLSVTEGALAAMRAAFSRTHPEMTEDAIGDLVAAETSEGSFGIGGLGLTGHGAGGGSGSGYGGRSARSPRIRAGHASRGLPVTAGNLGRLVRERFPPTLLFRPSIALDPNGDTAIDVPLADAVTTYLVETIVWREDGWISSTRAHIEATRDLVVEAPVPPVAHVGDTLELPLRVSNRADEATTVRLSLVGDPSLGIPDTEPTELTIAPHDAAVVPVQITPTTLGDGAISVVATTPAGEVLDAVRRSLSVRPLSRRMERTAEGLTDGDLTLALDIPEGASPRTAEVDLVVGPALLPGRTSAPWSVWPRAGVLSPTGTPESFALCIAAGWDEDEVADETIEQWVFELTRSLSRLATEEPDDVGAMLRRHASVLLALGPVHRQSERRPDAADVLSLVERLRERVAARSVSVARDPETWVWSAAALAQAGGDPARVRELLRRLEPFIVTLGEDRWVATEGGRIEPTLLAALAELGIGRRPRAFSYLATVGRWTGRGHRLDGRAHALGRAVTRQLMVGPRAETVDLWIDGDHVAVPLAYGSARHEAPQLAVPGHHVIRVRAGAPVRVNATARFGLPHIARAAPPGPMSVTLDGEVRGLDQTADLTLTVRNQTPRTLPAPRLEVLLPTGAELPAEERQRLSQGRLVTVEGDVLAITLPPLLPGRSTTVPLPLRWSVAGRLHGLGVTALDRSRDDATVLPPRELVIVREEVNP